MKPSERYRQIKAEIPTRHLGIKEPFITERALLDLLDELHQEPATPAQRLAGPPPIPPLPQPPK